VNCRDEDGDDNTAGSELVFGESESDQADGCCNLTCMVAGERVETHLDSLCVVIVAVSPRVPVFDYRDLSSINLVPILEM
jgi:hypothetical protein